MELSFTSYCLVIVALAKVTAGQNLPSRDEENVIFHQLHPEVLHDTKTLPDGQEVTRLLQRNIPSRFYFSVEEDDSALSIVVTPCGSTLVWNFSYHGPYDDGGSADDLTGDNEAPLRFPVGDRFAADELHAFAGYSRSSYENEALPAGIYSVVLTATDTDSTVHIYISTTPYSDHPFPQLPSNHMIKVMAMSSHKVTLTWKASYIHGVGPTDMEYCVSVNTERNLPSLCAARSACGVETIPTLPPYVGFRSTWEQNPHRGLSLAGSRIEDSFLECVGTKTSFTWSQGSPSVQYYFDVFAVNRVLNTSAGYAGTNLTMPVKRSLDRLKDGKMYHVFLKRTRASKILRFYLTEPAENLQFITQVCKGKFRVRISKNGRVLERFSSKNLEYTSIQNASAGRYDIRIRSGHSKSSSMKLFASSSSVKYPFPVIPELTSLVVSESTCNSVTARWHGIDRRQQYCMFITPYDSWTPNRCAGRSKLARKVTCTFPVDQPSQSRLMSSTARHLTANSTYAVDVFVRRGESLSLAMDSVIASTQEHC